MWGRLLIGGAIAFALWGAIGCGEVDCPEGATYDGRRCVPDDAGPDAASMLDAGLDGGQADAAVDAGSELDAGPGGDAGFTDSGVDGGVPAGASVAGGWQHTCALAGGTLRCWGRNHHGQLGDGTTADSRSPVDVATLRLVADVAALDTHSCALLEIGEVHCWGANASGQLGDGSTEERHEPVATDGLGSAVRVGVGSSFSCALLATGAVSCWGTNSVGQLGTSFVSGSSSSPVSVHGIDAAVGLTVSSAHGCVVEEPDGTVSCWGWNVEGQLGNGTTTDATEPTRVLGLAGAVQVSSNGRHTCALVGATGSVSCWGWNDFGQLGNGTMTRSTTPVVVAGLDRPAVQVSAGGGHTCALLDDASVECWGLNDFGQLGDGTTDASNMPVMVLGLGAGTPVEVAAGDRHTCVRFADESLRCWGLNDHGQVGVGSTAMSISTPSVVL